MNHPLLARRVVEKLTDPSLFGEAFDQMECVTLTIKSRRRVSEEYNAKLGRPPERKQWKVETGPGVCFISEDAVKELAKDLEVRSPEFLKSKFELQAYKNDLSKILADPPKWEPDPVVTRVADAIGVIPGDTVRFDSGESYRVEKVTPEVITIGGGLLVTPEAGAKVVINGCTYEQSWSDAIRIEARALESAMLAPKSQAAPDPLIHTNAPAAPDFSGTPGSFLDAIKKASAQLERQVVENMAKHLVPPLFDPDAYAGQILMGPKEDDISRLYWHSAAIHGAYKPPIKVDPV